MTRNSSWLAAHPYVQPVADLEGLIDAAMTEITLPSVRMAVWNDFDADYRGGIPLLHSAAAAIDLACAAKPIAALVERASITPLPGRLGDEARALHGHFLRDPGAPRRSVAWLLDEDSSSFPHPGLLRYLGWTVLGCVLADVVDAFGGWRNDEHWLRNYCPTCGAPPAMGHVSGTDPGRLRLLSCGRCATTWRYRRTGCPYCEINDDHRLLVVDVNGEAGLRIDYCEACGGYLKTYSGDARFAP